MPHKPDGDKAYDPFEAWRELRDANLDVWAKFMIQGVNTDAYAKTTGAMLDQYLTASAPFREILEKTMVNVLGQLSMPTRDDFVSMAKQLTNIEMRLDDLDNKLDQIVVLMREASSREAGAHARGTRESVSREPAANQQASAEAAFHEPADDTGKDLPPRSKDKNSKDSNPKDKKEPR